MMGCGRGGSQVACWPYSTATGEDLVYRGGSCMFTWPEYVEVFVALLAIVNPLGIVPIFLSLTRDRADSERNALALMTAVSVGVTLLVALVVGEALLNIFGISLPSFRIAGGLLILLIALSMVLRRDGPTRTTMGTEDRPVDKTAVAVAPLAIPLLAGPGAISSIIIYAHRADSVGHAFLIAAEIVRVVAIIFVVFRLAASIAALVSPTGLQIISRIMGLLLAAIAVEFIGNGLVEIFPGLR